MGKKKKQNDIESMVLELLDHYPDTYVPLELLATALHMNAPRERKRVQKMLAGLAERDLVRLNASGQAKRTGPESDKPHPGLLEGVVDVNRHGVGFVAVPGYEEDIRIPRKKMHTALPGDRVRVRITGRDSGRMEGAITDVRERSGRLMVGTLVLSKGVCMIEPDEGIADTEFFIHPDQTRGAKDGDKVTFTLVDWIHPKALPQGQIVQVLGRAGSHEATMLSILAENQIRGEFPKDVEEQAEAIPTEIPEPEIRRRLDLRKERIFTIDPYDAKDFDDAIQVRLNEAGHYELGVHIADVTYYVRPGTVLDQEALERATSVYLVDRVIPMLPEKLSNGVCSLRPDEDKLTYSCIMEITPKGKLVRYAIEETVIRSVQRFTYEQAQEIIDGGRHWLEEDVRLANEMAKMLTAKRFREGSVDLDTPEPKFRLDANGKPLEVIVKERLDAHRLIEECMLMANKTVAAHIETLREVSRKTGRDSHPFLYRIHDKPDTDKLRNIAENLRPFGIQFHVTDDINPKQINLLLADVKDHPLQNTIQELVLRSMAKAVYAPKNIGHFGLGFKHYAHFTSPIRRYPDVLVHRLLKTYAEKLPGYRYAELDELGVHCSEKERSAAQAERDSVKQKQVEYLSERIGQTFDGVITGVTERGMFVKLNDIHCDGMVPVRLMEDDYYIHDPDRHMLIGRRRGRKYQLGDTLSVRVHETNIAARTVDLVLTASSHLDASHPRRRRK